MEEKVVYKELSYEVVGILFEVFNELGYGYQEKYYQNAVEKFLIDKKIAYQREVSCNIKIKGELVGRYFFDFLIDHKIILEIKKGRNFSRKDFEQVKGYLHASGKKLAIMANFTENKVRFTRVLNVL